jgi:uncharacterized protein YndB with AHSA1/START domain
MKSEFVYVSYIKTTWEKLWQLFTTPELIKQWWGGGINVESEWKTGSAWTMRYEDGRAADVGEILEIDPPGRLVLRWRNESDPDMKKEGFSRCAIDLEQMDGAVKLTVTHGMDVPDSKFIEAVSGGWPLVLSNLKSLVELGEIVFKERTDSYGRGRS